MKTGTEASHAAPGTGLGQGTLPIGGSQPGCPIVIPDHQLLRQIGKGSYGEVWLARHTMGMHRAVKIVYRASFHDQRPFERELSGIRKFEPISRSHEGFVDVLHVGLNPEEGYFYYVMEVGDDVASAQTIDPTTYAPKTLGTEITQRGRLSLPECIQLGLALSQALAELHQHGLVHRDIKPSNVIFVNGRPKLADIGLVTEIQQASTYVGTEGFIPPEGPGTPGADVYALGKVLYEACTGLDRKEFPTLPDWWDESPELSALLEFNEILIQACRAEPARRYRTARELHADLVVLENGKSLRRLRQLERRLTSLKRFATVAALVSVGLGVVGYGAYQGWRRNIDAHQRQVGGDLAYGNRAMETGDYLQALPYFADALRLDQGQPQQEKNDRLRLGTLLAQCPKLTQMWFLSKELYAGQFSPDGQKVVLGEFYGRARVFDIASGQLCGEPFGQDALYDASFTGDGSGVLAASTYGGVTIWEVGTAKRLRHWQSPSGVYCARLSPDGSRLVTACIDGLVRVWDGTRSTDEPLLMLKGHHGPVRCAGFSHDGRLIVSGGEDGKAYLWEAATGRNLGKTLEHQSWICWAAFSPDDRRVVTVSDDHRARVWDVETGKQILSDLSHGDSVKGADFSPDGRLLVTCDLGGEVHLWDAESLQPLAANSVLKQGERAIRVCFSHDGHRILVTCADGSARIWDLAGSVQTPQPVTGTYSQDGTCFLTRTNDTAQLWDTLSGLARSPRIPTGPLCREPELSCNGRYLLGVQVTNPATGATNYCAQVWETASGKAISPGLPLPGPVQGAALNEDGTRVVTFAGEQAQVWDTRTGKLTFPPLSHEGPVREAIFSPDGRRLATHAIYRVKVWDVQTGRQLFPTLIHPQPVSDVEFSPDSSRLATACTDDAFTKCFAQLWDAATGRPVGPRLNHGDGVLRATFNADGSCLTTASEDFSALLWETATGRRRGAPLRHHHQVHDAVFSPDSKWVLTASGDETARVWSAETGDPLTPPLHYPEPLDRAQFLADGRQFVAIGRSEVTWLRHLSADERPVDDLLKLSYLLSGGNESSSPRFIHSRAESMRAVWNELRAKYPADFCVSAQEVSEWEALQAQEDEQNHRWSAAVFHLQRLLKLHPGNQSFAERLAGAKRAE